MRNSLLTLILLLGSLNLVHADWKAIPGGTFYRHIDLDPTTINPITSTDMYASNIHEFVLDTLLKQNPDTDAWEPGLAVKWDIAKDGKSFTFKLREGVKWHDGQPFTAEDVKYSFDVFFDPKWQVPFKRLYFEKIKEVVVIDSMTVKFVLKEVYFKNFEVAVSDFLKIIPKHFYESGVPGDAKFNKQLIGTGPYVLETWERGQKIVLKKNENYWGNHVPNLKGFFNFERLYFRPVNHVEVAMELLKKGNLDYIDLSRNPDQFVEKTTGEDWGPGKKLLAVKATNKMKENFDYAFIAWNQKHPFFGDRDVRMAMSHLINRDLMIDKFRYNLSEKAVGPFGNKSPASSPKVKAVEFNPDLALKLLKKAGWRLEGENLVKNIGGKETRFEFTFMTANPAFDRYATVIKEDMKKVGITMNIKLLEWNSFIKLVDERKFDAINMGWTVGSMEMDPKQLFHSAEIASPGHNFMSYSNPKADELIEKIERTMDKKVRQKYYHELHEIIAADQPYSFLFNRKFTVYAQAGHIKKPKDLFNYEIGFTTWWMGD